MNLSKLSTKYYSPCSLSSPTKNNLFSKRNKRTPGEICHASYSKLNNVLKFDPLDELIKCNIIKYGNSITLIN